VDLVVWVTGGEALGEAMLLLVGEVLGPDQQGAPDPVERAVGVSATPQGLLLIPAANPALNTPLETSASTTTSSACLRMRRTSRSPTPPSTRP
jgi:hypothetical protein